ncbi:transmembrane protein 164-like [Acropora millepora]|uniref:transmembrane protein 164-like n=1 Tax=Acropora millepora TaxID=45264 RepID=UPI0010FCCA7C|nr:transmembrane protein 164-like [Acropora millepora]
MEVPHSFPIVMLNITHIVDILYGGVDFTLPGNGGKECVEYLTLKQRIIETVAYELFTIFVFYKILGKVSMPKELPVSREGTGAGKRFLLVLLCLVFGIEIGFKFATKQVIFLLNPCHVVTAIQIYLLAVPPSKKVLCVFRVHNYLLFGALQAVLFPVVNTRLLPFEVANYWIQHLLILAVVPFFLVSCQGPFVVEHLWDFTWPTLTFTLFSFYMLLFLQPLGMILQVNLNNMVCPAVSDPFSGPYYRIIGCCHQPLLIFLYGKIFCVLGHKFVETFSGTQPQKLD